MLGVTAATGFIDWAPTKYLPSTGPLANLRISQWLDEQYMLMSVATLVGFVWIMYLFAHGASRASETGASRRARVARRAAAAQQRQPQQRRRASATSAAAATRGRAARSAESGCNDGRATRWRAAGLEMKKAAGGDRRGLSESIEG